MAQFRITYARRPSPDQLDEFAGLRQRTGGLFSKQGLRRQVTTDVLHMRQPAAALVLRHGSHPQMPATYNAGAQVRFLTKSERHL